MKDYGGGVTLKEGIRRIKLAEMDRGGDTIV